MLSGLPWLLLLWFPIQFSFQIDVKCSVGYLGSFSNDFLFQFSCKTDAKCSLGCNGSFCNRFLFSSYPKLMQNVLWAALVPPVMVSYSATCTHASWPQADGPLLPPCVSDASVGCSQVRLPRLEDRLTRIEQSRQEAPDHTQRLSKPSAFVTSWHDLSYGKACKTIGKQ